MKKTILARLIKILGLVFILSFQVSLTNSYFSDRVKITGSVLAGKWTPPTSQLVIDGYPVEERISQADQLEEQVITAGVKSLGFEYNFSSYDQPPFDNPGFWLLINQQPVFVQPGLDLSQQNWQTGWQKLVIDLSQLPATDLSLEFRVNNAPDELNPSQLEIRGLTTAAAGVNLSSQICLTADEAGSTSYYQVQEWGISYDPGAWQEYSGCFQLDQGLNDGNYTLFYYAVDPSLNQEDIQSAWLSLDNSGPDPIGSIQSYSTAETIRLVWLVPDDSGQRPSFYNYYTTNSDCPAFDLGQASLASSSPVQLLVGQPEEVELNNPGAGCLGIVSCDASLNCSSAALVDL